MDPTGLKWSGLEPIWTEIDAAGSVIININTQI